MAKISKKLGELLSTHGVTAFVLRFSGGSDEGYLDIEVDYSDESAVTNSQQKEVKKAIDDWAWESYNYNGAGDGTSYGDTYTYNLRDKTISHEEWYTVEETRTSPVGKVSFDDVE